MEFKRNYMMVKLNNRRVLQLQSLLAFVGAFFLYMFYAIMDAGSGGPFSFLFALITGGFFSILSVLICLLIGLPIRLHNGLKRWWTKSYILPLLMIMGGLFCVALSLAPARMDLVTMPEDPNGSQKLIPDVGLALAGWFTTIFGVLHTLLPTGFGWMRHQGTSPQPDN